MASRASGCIHWLTAAAILVLTLAHCSGPDRATPVGDADLGDAAADAAVPALRTTEDQPDDAPGTYQLHALYVEASDRDAMPRLDEDGTIARAITSFNRWLAARTGGPKLRIDTHNGVIDVTYVKLAITEAALAQGIGFTAASAVPRNMHQRLDALLRPQFSDPTKLYLVYYDGLMLGSCGDAPLGGHTAMTYIGGIWTSTFLRTAAGATATSIEVYDPIASQLPAPPFAAHLGNEAVTVSGIAGTTVMLAAALAGPHPLGELLKPDQRPQDCRLNPFSRDGVEFTYATFVGVHEVAHALGIVAPGAPDYALPPIAPGHLGPGSAAGLADLMYQGVANGRCGDYAAKAEDSPCQLDPAHVNYFKLPDGSPLVDLAKSVFLEPTANNAITPPNW